MFTLTRKYCHKHGMTGTLTLPDGFLLYSLERGWRDPDIKPIPPGRYQLVPHTGLRWRNVYALVNKDLGVTHYLPVKHPSPRTAILIHPANFASELKGCITLGCLSSMERDRNRDMQKVPFVGLSRKAVDLFNARVKESNDPTLEIVEHENVSALRTRV